MEEEDFLFLLNLLGYITFQLSNAEIGQCVQGHQNIFLKPPLKKVTIFQRDLHKDIILLQNSPCSVFLTLFIGCCIRVHHCSKYETISNGTSIQYYT